MELGQKKPFGPSPPLRVAEPSAVELALNAQLIRDLGRFLEPDVLAAKRAKIPQWIEAQFRAAYASRPALREELVAAMPFGSCALGADLADSDLDVALFVSQAFGVDPGAFFDRFPAVLRKAGAGKVVAITAARVPLIKLTVVGITIDLLFVVVVPTPPVRRLEGNKQRLLELLLKDLVAFAHDTRASSTGVVTAHEIMVRVPHDAVYRTVLRSVKLWAMRRGVYGNLFAFFPGVALAVMVARACQLVPSECPYVVLAAFFQIFARLLGNMGAIKPITIGEASMLPDPRSAGCAGAALVVADPVPPHGNKAFCVGRAGLEHFYAEVVRANTIFPPTGGSGAAVVAADATPSSGSSSTNAQTARLLRPWRRLWKPYDLTADFLQVLVLRVQIDPVDAAAGSLAPPPSDTEREERELMNIGLVESKLRMLVYALEAVQAPVDAASHEDEKAGRGLLSDDQSAESAAAPKPLRLDVRAHPSRLTAPPEGSVFATAEAAAAQPMAVFYVFGVRLLDERRCVARPVVADDVRDAMRAFTRALQLGSVHVDGSGGSGKPNNLREPSFAVETVGGASALPAAQGGPQAAPASEGISGAPSAKSTRREAAHVDS